VKNSLRGLKLLLLLQLLLQLLLLVVVVLWSKIFYFPAAPKIGSFSGVVALPVKTPI
jgi:hypothetical protein